MSSAIEIELEILQASHMEHFNHAKSLAFILPFNHPKRVAVEKTLNDITDRIQLLKKQQEKEKTCKNPNNEEKER